MAVRFDAAADRLTHNGAFPQTSAGFTFTAWVKIVVDRNAFSTFARFSAAGSTIASLITLSSGTAGPGYVTPTMTSGCEFSTDLAATTGVWVPIAMCRTAAGTTARVYRKTDGTAATTSVSIATTGTTGTPDQVCLGGRGSADATDPFDGSMAYVRIWSTELSQAEIEAEWASTVPVKATSLHSNWALSTATDLTDTVASRTLAVQAGGSLATDTGPSLAAAAAGRPADTRQQRIRPLLVR